MSEQSPVARRPVVAKVVDRPGVRWFVAAVVAVSLGCASSRA